jgi:hypothetical protein
LTKATKYDTIIVMIKRLLAITILMTAVFLAPFISIGNESKNNYDKVVRDAAAHFGIENYRMNFLKGNFLNAGNNVVQGSIMQEFDDNLGRTHVITVHTNLSRPMVIATIFHEFAHAAQIEFAYTMNFGDFHIEQHAEVLAFHAMWTSKYWWHAVHMLSMHSFAMKPNDYRAPKTLWSIAMTGNNPTGFRSQAM